MNVPKEVERYRHDHATSLFPYSPHTLFAVANRIAFTAYETCISELAKTKIKR